jgi:hypothetical protein
MNKKADLSIQVIIVAAIALIVLVILVYLVVDNLGGLQKGVACTKAGGICSDSCDTEIVGDQDARDSCAPKFCCRPI